jgi:hypothetical protein
MTAGESNRYRAAMIRVAVRLQPHHAEVAVENAVPDREGADVRDRIAQRGGR